MRQATSTPATMDLNHGQQLALPEGSTPPPKATSQTTARATHARSTQPKSMQPKSMQPKSILCAACREREARYGFRDEDNPAAERPRTLCFACFRVEISRRQAVAARLARGWNAEQVRLPLEETLRALTTRRRRAQIAARHALDSR